VQLTSQQIEALAGDPATLTRAKKLAQPRSWTGLGRSARACWGECRGSKVYQVRVELAGLVSRCSCPVRKLPCKHALGLLLVLAQHAAAVGHGAEPTWVSEWLDKRAAAKAAKAAKTGGVAAAPKPVDSDAQAKRAEKRAARVAEGIDQLDLWLHDLVRIGLATVQENSPGIFEDQARRLVDAQAPGLAAWVRRLAGIVLASGDWPRRLLAQLGRLSLLIRAYRRIDALDPDLQADLRQLIGWTVPRDEVLRSGERLHDRWQTIAQEIRDADRLSTQTTWLLGQRSGARAMVLRFAVGSRQRFADPLMLGVEFEGQLAYYPGAARQRALIVDQEVPTEIREPLRGGMTIDQVLDDTASALARQPWLERFGVVLSQVAPVLRDDGALCLVDRSGQSVPASGVDPYLLLALSGGAAIDLGGEWDGEIFTPSLTVHGGHAHLLRPRPPAPEPR